MSKTFDVIKPLTGIRKYVSIKYKRFIKAYETLMIKRFPSTYRMIQMFTIGTKDFSSDVFQYMKISKDLTFNRSVNDLSYKELMTYMQTPKDMRKMVPFLLVSSLPLAQYVTIPFSLLFPKKILSFHYWTIDQRNRFAIQDHTRKLFHYRPIFRHLQYKLDQFSNGNEHYFICQRVFAKLGSGTHPSVDSILRLKSLFAEGPYGLNSLSHSHLFHLCRIYGLNMLPGKRMRLKNHIYFIQQLDRALQIEIDQDPSLDDLKKACFLRGLNPTNLNRDEMINWLKMWNEISENVNEDNLSLLLHAPIFLTYNHPSNWRLIH